MKQCTSAYIGLDKKTFPYYTTAQECIYALKRRGEFNFWTLPDSEFVKLAKYYKKTVCNEDIGRFTLEKLRDAKNQAMIEHINTTPYVTPPQPKCQFAVDINGKEKSCTLYKDHTGRHGY